LVVKKNIDGVLKALRQIIGQVPEVRYLIAGDGEERESLEKLRDALGLQPYVLFLGNIEHSKLPSFYCASDLFILPSYEVKGNVETFGISFIEASACGKPVIAGKGGGVEDAVIDGETGLLVDPCDIDEIAAAILHLLTDHKLACQMGENGRRKAEQLFSWEKVGERLNKIISEVVNNESV
jgi:phosphatidylinositol alpha-1,6-mannosyltransferase